MTTRLEGENTFFLPFNKGYDGGAGNPPNPDGYSTDYLWKEVFARDAWLGHPRPLHPPAAGCEGKLARET